MRHVSTFDTEPMIGRPVVGTLAGITKRGRVFYEKRFVGMYLGTATVRGETVHRLKHAVIQNAAFASIELAASKFVTTAELAELTGRED
jgi:hypothetical protein